MRKEEIVEIKRRDITKFCDLCGKEMDEFNFNNCHLSAYGYIAQYSEDESNLIEYDICVDCFNEKIRDLLKGLGLIEYEN